jgi:signal transduction protein with GAF and PtsI domain
VEQLQALQTIDRAITASLDLRLSLNVLLDQTVEQLRADAAGVLLLEPRTLTLVFAAGRGFRELNYERSRVHLGEGQAGHAALERQTLHVADLKASTPAFTRLSFLAAEGFISSAATPLVSKGQIRRSKLPSQRIPPRRRLAGLPSALAQRHSLR